jgi:phospho-N-acetylmuramoyl-pentapeptide-transferase
MQLVDEIVLQYILRIGLAAFTTFALSMAITPLFTFFAYKYKWWKKARTTTWISDGKEEATVYKSIHEEKHKRNIPTMAGVLIWIPVAIVTLLTNLDRAQTWLPLFALVAVGILGLVDDYINIRGLNGGIAGIKARVKMGWLIGISLVGAYWFHFKLERSVIDIPMYGVVDIGLLYIVLFILVVVSAANAVNITDGLDGLSGGLLFFAFGAYAVIALLQQNYGIAIFCATIVGAVLSYTWFNIYPARFFMGDTGAVSLGATLGVVAMLTNTVFILPIIAFVFVFETLSVIIQLTSKKFLKKKVFLSAPIHHHFEASGWPEPKVTMRFWVIGAVSAVVGIIISILGIL